MDRPALFSRTVYVNYGIAVVLLWLFFRNTAWGVLSDGLRSVGWGVLGAAIALRLVSLVLSSLRWQALLAPVRHVPLGPVVAAMMMGMAVNMIVSMQAAEVVRPYLLSKRQGLDFSTTFATVTVEWLLDVLGVLVVFIPALLWVRAVGIGNTPPPGVSSWALALTVFVCLAGLAMLRLLPGRLGGWGAWMRNSALPKEFSRRVADQFQFFTVGLRILDRPGGLASVSAYSVLVAFVTALSAWLALIAFGLTVPLMSGFLILGLITVGGMIPTPGAVGGFHAVCQLGLVALFGIDRAETVLPVMGLHAVLYVPPAVIGALCFATAGSQLQRSEV